MMLPNLSYTGGILHIYIFSENIVLNFMVWEESHFLEKKVQNQKPLNQEGYKKQWVEELAFIGLLH